MSRFTLPQNLLHLLQNLSHRIWSILLGFNCFHGQLSSIFFSCHICSLLRHLPFAINALPLPRFLLHLSCRDVISAVALVTDYGREGVEMRNPLPLGRRATAQQPGVGRTQLWRATALPRWARTPSSHFYAVVTHDINIIRIFVLMFFCLLTSNSSRYYHHSHCLPINLKLTPLNTLILISFLTWTYPKASFMLALPFFRMVDFES